MIKRSLIMSNVISLADYREMKLRAVVSEPLVASRESTQAPQTRPASKPYYCDAYNRAVLFLREVLPGLGLVSFKYLESLAAQRGIPRQMLFDAKPEYPIYCRKEADGWYWGLVPREQAQQVKRKLTAAEKAGIKVGDRIRHAELGNGTVISQDHSLQQTAERGQRNAR
jgi:hypothetical protein